MTLPGLVENSCKSFPVKFVVVDPRVRHLRESLLVKNWRLAGDTNLEMQLITTIVAGDLHFPGDHLGAA